MTDFGPAILLVSGILFLGTVGLIIRNAATLAAMFGKRRRDADDGEMIAPRQPSPKLASTRTMWIVLGLHLVGIAGLIFGTMLMVGMISANHPSGTPDELNPVHLKP